MEHLVSEESAQQMKACSVDFPPGVGEFAASGLTPIPSAIVVPPWVKEAKACMECRLLQVVHVSPKPLGASLVPGEVLRFAVDDGLFDNFTIEPEGLRAFGRMGGPTYTRTTDRFAMDRPPLPKQH